MTRKQGGKLGTAWAALLGAALLSGCANLQMPRIDPTGQQFLTTAPAATPGMATPVVQSSNPCCNLFNHAHLTALHSHLSCGHNLLDHSCFKHEHWANLLNHGWCGQAKQPCGPPVLPGSAAPLPPPGLSIAPNQVIAPVGSEVVMLASIHNQDGRPAGNQQVEWILAPNGVGYFMARGNTGHNWHCFPSSLPKKVANDYALANTSNRLVTITRGTPTPLDDVPVALGQAWISVSSPTEGTSYVTAFAPNVQSWDQHQRTGVVHWVDAQWNPPPAAVNPVGTRHTLVTSVSRQTDGTPIAGWQVRYEILSGPPAAFGEGGAQAVDVTTNDLGQAVTEIIQTQPTPGTNQISVRLVRPVNSARGDERPLTIGSATTQKTWTSPEIAVRVVGPSQASLGATASFQVQVSNPGDLPARGVVVTVPTPHGLTYLSSTPPVTPVGSQLEFNLLDIAAKQSQTIAIDYRIDGPGQAQVCANVRTAEGLSAQDCVTTALTAPTLAVQIIGPDRGVVGQNLDFEVVVSNAGAAPATKLVIIDTYDPGLQHEIQGKIEKDLGDLGPGQSRRVGIRFRAATVGRQCHTVEIVGEGGARATAQACVDISQPAGVPPVVVPPGSPPAGSAPPTGASPSAPPGEPGLSVRNTGPSIRNVGEVAEFVIDVTNTGEAAQQGLKLSVDYDPALLKPEAATKGIPATGELIWDLPQLLPGQTQRFRVQCRCLTPGRACNMATITAANGLKMAQEACVEIRAAAGGQAAAPAETAPAESGPALSAAPAAASLESPASRITVSVAEQSDPVRVGSETTYFVSVRNPASFPDQQVQLKVALPQELQLLSGSGPTRNRIAGQTITFEPIAELRAGEQVEYRLRVKAATPGTARLDAHVTSRGLAQPLVKNETTLVVGG